MEIKVLVVEDKESLNRTIVNMLEKEGYVAFGATDIDAAKKVFLKHMPHIILLDVMLPSGNGYDLIPFFRNYNDSSILMLTALNDVQCKRTSYENGADDYITKPFDLYEIIYKLGAMRRRIMANLKVYQIGDIVCDSDSNTLTCKDKTVTIQPSQVRLLTKLYEKYDQNSHLDKEEFFDCQRTGIDESCRLQTLVARLRKNILDLESESVSIETIYGKGYQLVICLPRVKNG